MRIMTITHSIKGIHGALLQSMLCGMLLAANTSTLAQQAKPATSAKPAPVPAAAAKPAVAAKPAPIPAAAPTPGKSFLWEVKGPATDKRYAGKRLWLYGTMHVGKPDFYPLSTAVEKALAGSGVLAVEADISNQAALDASAPLMLYSPPETIETHLPAPLLERLRKQLDRFGIPFDAAKTMRPFILAGLLAVTEYTRQGFDQQLGVDGYLLRKAAERKLPLVELEGVQQQMKLMVGMSEEDQVAFLDNSLATLESGEAGAQMAALVKAWRSGDAAALEKIATDATRNHKRAAALEELLMHSRNPAMQARAEDMLLDGKTHFVAVGALHLVGKRGIVEGLRSKGFVVTQQ
jgi:uncharacterized protein